MEDLIIDSIELVSGHEIEIRADTNKSKTSKTKTLRAIARKTLRNKVRNDDIQQICGVITMVYSGRHRNGEWRDRIKRMDVTWIARIASEGQPIDQQPTSTPHTICEYSWQSRKRSIDFNKG